MNRRRLGLKLMAAFFLLLSVNGFAQGVLALLGRGSDPLPLALWQLAIGGAGLITAVGSWRGAGWASKAALLYGVVTATMIASLEPLLGLGSEARGGLWTGAIFTLAVVGACAWYLRRATRPPAGELGVTQST